MIQASDPLDPPPLLAPLQAPPANPRAPPNTTPRSNLRTDTWIKARRRQFDEIFLQRAAGPYIIKSIAFCNRRQRLDFRYTPLATKFARHCNMSRRATNGH